VRELWSFVFSTGGALITSRMRAGLLRRLCSGSFTQTVSAGSTRATGQQPRRVRRHQRDRPGELIHVDVKKIAGIPDGGGWRRRGRGFDGQFRNRPVRCRFIHTALDDRTRMIYSEILDNEQAVTAAGFWA